MTRKSLADMSTAELVDQFVSIALAQDKAISYDENSKYNSLYKKMDFVEAALKQREGDQRRLLLPFLQHPNAQVRLKAAIVTLAVDQSAALAALQKISDHNEYPQAADARGMMRAVAEGS